MYDKVNELAVEIGGIESGIQAWIGPNGIMRKQMNEHKNIVSGFGALEKKVAAIENAQVDKKMMAKNFKRIGDLEKKVASLEAELKKCCTKSAASSRASSRANSTRRAGRVVQGRVGRVVQEVVALGVVVLEHGVVAEVYHLIARIHMIVM